MPSLLDGRVDFDEVLWGCSNPGLAIAGQFMDIPEI
jgi:hypothetical protein